MTENWGWDGFPKGTYEIAMKLRKFVKRHDITPLDVSRAELLLRNIIDNEKKEFYPLNNFNFDNIINSPYTKTLQETRDRTKRLELCQKIKEYVMKHKRISLKLLTEFNQSSCYGINCECSESKEHHIKCPLGSQLCKTYIWQP